MFTNFIAEPDILVDVVSTVAWQAGDLCVEGEFYGVCMAGKTLTIGDKFPMLIRGKVTVTTDTADTWAAGAPLYFDTSTPGSTKVEVLPAAGAFSAKAFSIEANVDAKTSIDIYITPNAVPKIECGKDAFATSGTTKEVTTALTTCLAAIVTPVDPTWSDSSTGQDMLFCDGVITTAAITVSRTAAVKSGMEFFFTFIGY